MSGYLGDLSSLQEKALEEMKEMSTEESTADEVSLEWKRLLCEVVKGGAIKFALLRLN